MANIIHANAVGAIDRANTLSAQNRMRVVRTAVAWKAPGRVFRKDSTTAKMLGLGLNFGSFFMAGYVDVRRLCRRCSL